MKQVLRWFLALAVVVTLSGMAEGAFAQGAGGFNSAGIGGGDGGRGELFTQAERLTDSTVGRTQQVIYGMGGLGAIALGALAFFGRFQWSWFFGLVGGLVLIAGLQQGIQYFTGNEDTFAAQPRNQAGR
jgi:hypothetical protein